MQKHACFTVNGKPFYSIGIQAHNSSSDMPEKMEQTWHAAKMLGVNTVAVPVPWARFEPEEGVFDDAFVRTILAQARTRGLHVVFLWFGTWKNGTMEYAPEWVKCDTARFARVELKGGRKTLNLSPHCPANLEADSKAFCRFMQLLRQEDAQTQTVIAVQIENEAGLLSGTRRDFSSWGEAAFLADVPQVLHDWCDRYPDCSLARSRRSRTGSWGEVFGSDGAEYVTAYAVASYINAIAQAGKQQYDIFCYTNAWLCTGRGIAGIDWPSGTCHERNLEIYYAVCDCLDTIAPDIYLPETTRYLQTLKQYHRPELGMPLYVPESARTIFNSGILIEAVGAGSIGVHVFGGESLLNDAQDALTDEGVSMMHTFEMLRQMQQLLERGLQGETVYPIYRRGNEPNACIEGLRGGWRAFISFTGTVDGFYRMDYRHKQACQRETEGNLGEPSRGLLVQTEDNTFYVAGHGFRVFLLPPLPEDGSIDAMDAANAIYPTNAEYCSVCEGVFASNGAYQIRQRRTGDECRHGVFAQWDNGVIQIRMSKLK